MIAIIVPIESECSSFSEVLSNLGFLTRKVFWKNHCVPFYKKSNSLKANFLQKEPFGWNGRNNKGFCAVLKNYEHLRISSQEQQQLYRNEPRSRFLSSFKLTLGNEFPESVIHIDYDRYCYSYRIRKLFVFQQAIRYCFSHSSQGSF